jgi:hypothetical protein
MIFATYLLPKFWKTPSSPTSVTALFFLIRQYSFSATCMFLSTYNQDGWRSFRRIQDAYVTCSCFIPLVDIDVNPMWRMNCKLWILKLCNKAGWVHQLMQRRRLRSPFQKINILWTSEATNITTVVQNLRHYQIVTKFSKRPLTCRLQVAHLDWECPPAYTHAYLTICCQGATSHAPTLAANIDWYQCVSKGRTVWHYKHNKVYHWVLHCTKVYSIINISHEKHQIILSIWLDI